MNSLIPESDDLRLGRAKEECKAFHGVGKHSDAQIGCAIDVLLRFELDVNAPNVAYVLAARSRKGIEERVARILPRRLAMGGGGDGGLNTATFRAFIEQNRNFFTPFIAQEFADERDAIERKHAAAEASLRQAEIERNNAARLLSEFESTNAALQARLANATDRFQVIAQQSAESAKVIGLLVGRLSASEGLALRSEAELRRRFESLLRRLGDRSRQLEVAAKAQRQVARERGQLVDQLQRERRRLERRVQEAESAVTAHMGAAKQAEEACAVLEAQLKRATLGSLRRLGRLNASRAALAATKAEASQLRARVVELEGRRIASETERAALTRQLEHLQQQIVGRGTRAQRFREPKS